MQDSLFKAEYWDAKNTYVSLEPCTVNFQTAVDYFVKDYIMHTLQYFEAKIQNTTFPFFLARAQWSFWLP